MALPGLGEMRDHKQSDGTRAVIGRAECGDACSTLQSLRQWDGRCIPEGIPRVLGKVPHECHGESTASAWMTRAVELYLWLSILMPRQGGIYVPDLILGLVFAGMTLLQVVGHFPIRRPLPTKGLHTIAFVLMFSCLWNEFGASQPQGLESVAKELARVLRYGMLAVLGFNYGRFTRLNRLVQVVCSAAVASVCVAMVQVVDPPYIGALVRGLYPSLALTSEGARLAGNWRVGGTFSNPNVFGAFLVIPIAMESGALITGNSGESLFRRLCVLCTCVLGVILSQSRTALLASAVSVTYGGLVVAWMAARQRDKYRAVKGILLVSAAVGVVFGLSSRLINIARLGTFVASIGRGGITGSASFAYRLQLARQTISEVLSHNALLGFGIGITPTEALDSDYVYWFYYSGLLGLFSYGRLLHIWSDRLRRLAVGSVGIRAALAGLLIAGLTQGVFFSERVFSVMVLFVGGAMAQGCTRTGGIGCASSTPQSSSSVRDRGNVCNRGLY